MNEYMTHSISPWLILFALGAYHGINPGMGWLFAVALGLQEGSRKAVLRALPPIALGHALSVGVIVAIVLSLREALPIRALKIASATLLIGFGLSRLIRSRHPAWVGMRVGFKDLTAWSFLMASACGAGLMLIPVLLGSSMRMHSSSVHDSHTSHLSAIGIDTLSQGILAVFVHTLGQLLAAGAVAFLVYEVLGVAVLRKAWINLDLIWVAALVLAGVVVLCV